MIYGMFIFDKQTQRYSQFVIANSAHELPVLLGKFGSPQAYIELRKLLSVKTIELLPGKTVFHDCDNCRGELVVGAAMMVPSDNLDQVFAISKSHMEEMSRDPLPSIIPISLN